MVVAGATSLAYIVNLYRASCGSRFPAHGVVNGSEDSSDTSASEESQVSRLDLKELLQLRVQGRARLCRGVGTWQLSSLACATDNRTKQKFNCPE